MIGFFSPYPYRTLHRGTVMLSKAHAHARVHGFPAAKLTSAGAGGYVVSSATKNPKAVWEVIKFISGVEYQEG